MKELSLHILDIAQNSVKAKASLIEITIEESVAEDIYRISIRDNGCGMSKEIFERVRDPFTTTRTTRKVGLGIPLLEAAAMQCDGKLDIRSQEGDGTVVTATFRHSHIDRAPLGDMPLTITTLVSGSPEIDFLYTHIKDGAKFVFCTKDVREVLGEVPLDVPEVISWIEGTVREGLAELGAKG